MLKIEILPTPKDAKFTEDHVCVDQHWGVRDQSGLQDIAVRCAQEFCIPNRERAKNISLSRDDGLAPEEYLLNISTEGAGIRASTQRGFLHALSTLTQLRDGPLLPVGSVRDYPRLPIRGIHFMFESFKQMCLPEAMNLLTTAATLKLNAVLMEFGDRFPFEKHRVVSSPNTLTRSEVKQLLAHARSNGIQPIPLLQSLGHMNYLLKHDDYADIREEHDIKAQMCPSNEKSFQVFTELAEDILSVFDDCTLMHIGADETRQLGACPRCKAEVERTSKGLLYAKHINKVCDWLGRRGITPILWDDMLCAHPDGLDALHENAWIMYWDYWTTCDPSPLLIARYDREGKSHVVCDKRWMGEWRPELSTVTAHTLDAYCRPVDLKSDLTDKYMKVYGRYLGDRFPKFVRAFPYLEYYRDKGHKVLCGPTCSGNRSSWHTLPDFPRYGENIKCFADRAIESKAEGLITTAWYNRVPEILIPGMIATAEFGW